MALPFIDLKAQYKALEPAIRARIEAVLAHGQYIMGPEVKELEARLAEYVGVRHAVACASGTDAILWPLMAWDIGPGDAVITTPFTFIASAEVAALVGATPVFVDVDPSTYNLDPDKLVLCLKALAEKDPSIHPLPSNYKDLTAKAVIPVDLFGIVADYGRIAAACAPHGVKIVEDAAQSFGGTRDGQRAGSFGQAAGTSFFPAKPLGAYGDAGAVFTDDDGLAETFRSIRIHGMGGHQYNNVRVGMTGRCDSLQAAILLAKLEAFPAELEARQAVAARYAAGLSGVLATPAVPADCLSAWAQYSVLAQSGAQREALRAALQAAGVPTGVYYPLPLHRQPVFQHLGYAEGDFPVCEDLASRIFALPMHPYLSEADQATIIAAVREAVGA